MVNQRYAISLNLQFTYNLYTNYYFLESLTYLMNYLYIYISCHCWNTLFFPIIFPRNQNLLPLNIKFTYSYIINVLKSKDTPYFNSICIYYICLLFATKHRISKNKLRYTYSAISFLLIDFSTRSLSLIFATWYKKNNKKRHYHISKYNNIVHVRWDSFKQEVQLLCLI